MKRVDAAVFSVALFLSFFAPAAAVADTIPRVLKFSASLTSDSPTHFEPGVVGVTFSIYKEKDDETALWVGTQNVTIDADGRFTVLLGETENDGGVPLDLFTSGEARWLGMQRIPEREGERIRLASVPYALKAADAELLGGKPLSSFVTVAGDSKEKLKPGVNGAAGYIAKFIGVTNIDNSILYESAGRIGLNTTSPQGPLHINSVATYRNGGVGSVQTGTNPGIMLENPSTNSTVLLSEAFGFAVFASLSATAPLSGSDLRLVVRPTGNVGIAMNNPQAPLHIGATRLYRSLNVAAVQTGTNPGLMLENPTTNTTVALTENNGLSIYATPSATLPFTGADLKMVLTTAGNVGIGVSSPAQKLDVAGTINLSGNVMLPATSSLGGSILLGGSRFMHAGGTASTFLGQNAGNIGSPGYANTGIGYLALTNVVGGVSKTAVGQGSLTANNSGRDKTVIPAGFVPFGSYNFAGGTFALQNNQNGGFNVAVGAGSLQANTTGNYSVAVGMNALYNNNAEANVAVGVNALLSNTTGVGNIAIGSNAGQSLTTGSDNIDIGNNGATAESGTIRIGAGSQTKAFISGIRGKTTVAADAIPVVIDSNGQLGTVSSSRRYKFDIADMAGATEGLMRLRPVTFRYLQYGADGPRQYGLIAEEVADVYPELVARNKDGAVETVMYQYLTPMLLNQMQKQQKTIEMLVQRLEAVEAELASSREPRHQ